MFICIFYVPTLQVDRVSLNARIIPLNCGKGEMGKEREIRIGKKYSL